MIAEVLAWLTSQDAWISPILKVLVGFACIKYIIIDW